MPWIASANIKSNYKIEQLNINNLYQQLVLWANNCKLSSVNASSSTKKKSIKSCEIFYIHKEKKNSIENYA